LHPTCQDNKLTRRDHEAIRDQHRSAQLGCGAEHQRCQCRTTPPAYRSKPFEDSAYKAGPQVIPGKVECAYFDLGGEGVAYDDTDATSSGNGEWCNYTVEMKKAGTYKIIALYDNEANRFTFSIHNQLACECKFPVPTGSMDKWSRAQVGTITFPEAGVQLLTLHYNKG
jgi:hypothetical protein